MPRDGAGVVELVRADGADNDKRGKLHELGVWLFQLSAEEPSLSAKQGFRPAIPLAPALKAAFTQRNILLRPLDKTIHAMPPYCNEAEDLDAIYQAIEEVVARLCQRECTDER